MADWSNKNGGLGNKDRNIGIIVYRQNLKINEKTGEPVGLYITPLVIDNPNDPNPYLNTKEGSTPGSIDHSQYIAASVMDKIVAANPAGPQPVYKRDTGELIGEAYAINADMFANNKGETIIDPRTIQPSSSGAFTYDRYIQVLADRDAARQARDAARAQQQPQAQQAQAPAAGVWRNNAQRPAAQATQQGRGWAASAQRPAAQAQQPAAQAPAAQTNWAAQAAARAQAASAAYAPQAGNEGVEAQPF